MASIKEKVAVLRANASKAFYHFGKLPVETAYTIFSMALEDDYAKVVVLAQVCKAWRNTLLNATSFWSTLYLSRRNPARKATLWKRRFKERLEALHIHGNQETMLRALERLRDVPLDKLHTLTLNEMPFKTLHAHLPSLTPLILSSLRTINIQGTDASWIWGHSDLLVENLLLRAPPIDWQKLTSRCRNLKELSFEGEIEQHQTSDIVALLQRNEDLTNVYMSLAAPRVGPSQLDNDDDQALIPLRHLTHFAIAADCVNLTEIATRLSLPSLRVFHILKYSSGHLDGVLSHLVKTNAVDNLTELKLQRSYAMSDEILAVLERAKGLQVLVLSGMESGQVNIVVNELGTRHPPYSTSNPTNQLRILCPALRHVDFSETPDLRSGHIVRLVKHRLPSEDLEDDYNLSVSRIQTLMIDACNSIDQNILPWLRNNVNHVSCKFMTKKQASWKR